MLKLPRSFRCFSPPTALLALLVASGSVFACTESTENDGDGEALGGATGDGDGDSLSFDWAGTLLEADVLGVGIEASDFQNAQWSRAASFLMMRSVGKKSDLYLLDASDGGSDLFQKDTDPGIWSPTEDLYTWTERSGDETRLVLSDVGTGSEERWPDTESWCGMSWSPDGEYLVTTRRAELPPKRAEDEDGTEGHGVLVVLNRQGEEVFVSSDDAGYGQCEPQWSRDGKAIFFSSRDSAYSEWPVRRLQILSPEDNYSEKILSEGESFRSEIIVGPGEYYAVVTRGVESSSGALCTGTRSSELSCDLYYEEGVHIQAAFHHDDPYLMVTSAESPDLHFIDLGSQQHFIVPIESNAGTVTGLSDPAWSPIDSRLTLTIQVGMLRSVLISSGSGVASKFAK